MSDVDQKIKKIKDLHKKKGELYDELERSLALKKIWPEVFDHGQAKCYVDGFLAYPKEAKLVIKNGDGEERKILLKDAPRAIRDFHAKQFGNEHSPFMFYFKRLNKKEDDLERESRGEDRLDQIKAEPTEGTDREGKKLW